MATQDRRQDAGPEFSHVHDRAAFDAHLKTRHFEVFNRESEALVISKTVAQYNLACEGSQAP